MRKLLLFIICSVFYCSYAQLPPNSFGEDFTLTDINGDEFNLYEVLDEGKTVVLDLFATWCGPCWSFAETGVLEDIQEAYPDEVVCVAVEADPSTPESEIFNSGYGDWTDVIDYALMDDPSGDVANDYALAYYPTIYKICPDRMVTEIGQGPGNSYWSVNTLYNELSSCSQASYSKDMKMLMMNGAAAHCGGTAYPVVTVQNYSTNATVSDFEILAMQNGQVLSETSWSGSLDLYQTATVELNPVDGLSGNENLTFEVQYSGDQDESNNSISASFSAVTEESSPSVSLHIETDGWGYETSFSLIDLSGTVIEAVDGTLENESTYDYEWNLDPGCYVFTVADSYGDGVAGAQWGSIDGIIQLVDETNNDILWEGVDFGDGATLSFQVLSELNIEDLEATEISIFPNPFKDYTNLAISSNGTQEMIIEIYNSLGKVVYNDNIVLNSGANNVKIESGDLIPGHYYINAIINGENNLKPLSIIK